MKDITNRQWLESIDNTTFAKWLFYVTYEGFDAKVNEKWCSSECEHYEECMTDGLTDCMHTAATPYETYEWWLDQLHTEEDEPGDDYE